MLKQKTLHIVILFIFAASLYAGGVSATTVCTAECCLQTHSTGMHVATGGQMRSLSYCHPKIPSIPCDLKSGKTVKIPECTLTTTDNSSPKTLGTIRILSNFGFDDVAVQPHFLDQTAAEKFHPPPIYLQVQSFII